jgi:hypothetical protein
MFFQLLGEKEEIILLFVIFCFFYECLGDALLIDVWRTIIDILDYFIQFALFRFLWHQLI